MATFLEVGILQHFLPVFTFLFVLVVVYALMSKTKILGENSKVHWVAALTISFIVLLTGEMTDLINYITPLFVVILIFLVLLFFIILPFGVKQEDIWSKLGGHTTVVIICILILVLGVSNVFGIFNPYEGGAESTPGGEIVRAIFSPQVLGALAILIIAAFAIQRITDVTK